MQQDNKNPAVLYFISTTELVKQKTTHKYLNVTVVSTNFKELL